MFQQVYGTIHGTSGGAGARGAGKFVQPYKGAVQNNQRHRRRLLALAIVRVRRPGRAGGTTGSKGVKRRPARQHGTRQWRLGGTTGVILQVRNPSQRWQAGMVFTAAGVIRRRACGKAARQAVPKQPTAANNKAEPQQSPPGGKRAAAGSVCT